MGRVEKMLEATESVSVAFMIFSRVAARDRQAIFCFFEGEDEKYYSGRINFVFGHRPWHPINCGGKNAVLETQREIRSRTYYDKHTVAFFVDRDFDEPISRTMADEIYETPCYSIENLYCDPQAIKRILSAEFGLADQAGLNEQFTQIYDRILECQNAFHELILPLNLFIKAHRLAEKHSGIKRLNLKNVRLEQVVSICLDKVERLIADEDLNSLYPESIPIENIDFSSIPSFHGTNLCYELRGKYELEFIRIILCRLKEACSCKEHVFCRKGYSVKLNLTKANTISELSQYATTPPCLIKFLTKLAGWPP
ncbi:DUF4435 domain-containing protein [Propionivibrio dicarboxylicus]|uniref:DUF4435 domain-containing protein n=1 Tax=Propionivibrio dicarboxylicus TaxID=83767 RepID=A0A1G7WM14_9RHOO|nr:DUF4435 domain-containing protein [Propionivibrio dicarboxylicus]SDG73055.1 Protein of unknown function [Propionivibrio dicarboxylicus]